MNNDTIPEYQINEQDYHNAKLLLHKLGETQWQLRGLQMEVARKFAHLSELAYSLKYLPAMKGEEEKLEDIQREARHLFESNISSLLIFHQRFNDQEEKLHRHMYVVGKSFYKTEEVQAVCEAKEADREEQING